MGGGGGFKIFLEEDLNDVLQTEIVWGWTVGGPCTFFLVGSSLGWFRISGNLGMQSAWFGYC